VDRRSSTGFTAAVLATSVALGLASCGGGSGGSSSSAAKSLGDIRVCLANAGYVATLTPFGAQIAVALPPGNKGTAFTVTINKTEQAAQHQVGDQIAEFGPKGANTGGGAISSGDVVIAYAHKQASSDLDKVKACAF